MPPMIEVLTPIWQRVLQRSPIGVGDNFFDLGGDPSLAAKIFAEIAQVCGRDLPSVMIYHAPTIGAQAALLEHPAPSRSLSLVLLKPGSHKQPVFIAPGIGGDVIEFFQLVKHIQSQHPIYGLQAMDGDGSKESFGRIEDTAGFYLDAIKELQPHGPYVLIGYSLGGLVMLEMAQRLSEGGEKVALLAMLETYPHMHYLPLGQRAGIIARQARLHVSTARQLPLREGLSYIIRRARRKLHISRGRSRSGPSQASVDASRTSAMQRARNNDYLAWSRYQPRFYHGEIKFVRAGTSLHFPDNPTAVWANLAEQFEVETVPGDHIGIITTHFEKLASVLSRYLREIS